MVRPDIFLPGTRFKLMAPAATKAKLSSSLIGYKYGKYLLLEHPDLKKGLALMEEGTTWLVNFISQGDIISFSSQVVGSSRHPVPLLFLSYPDALDRTVLRQSKRIPVSLNASCSAPSGLNTGEESCTGIILDISAGGCQMVSTKSFQPNDLMELTMDLPQGSKVNALSAEVKSCRDVGGRYLLGLSFGPSLTKPNYQPLKTFIENLHSIPIRF
ncbi:MAG: flagellar brake protein [Deltaproteobacteria bacterium]|nr:flagellar brake protein [Deltaproteobacteria bacterium]